MRYCLRLTENQQKALQEHLQPGDGLEAAALLLCGRRRGAARHVFTVRQVIAVPYGACLRTHDKVTWPTDLLDPLICEAYQRGQAIVKVHSHTTERREFSSTDDDSDRGVLGAVARLAGDGPHASVIMLPDGSLFGRVVGEEGPADPLASVMVVGDDLKVWRPGPPCGVDAFAMRHAQAFGAGTTSLLRALSVAVVGCSGTGSVVIEQLARLGVGRLVLVDPDEVEEKNLNRILNSGKADAYLRRPKVEVMATAVAHMGLGQEVEVLRMDVAKPEAVRAVAECDVVFGCMDGVEGRHLVNRLATFYCMPYVDVGVGLDADGRGGVAAVAGAVHFLQPGRSSLLSRGVYTMEDVEAAAMRRANPLLYERHREEGYLRGVQEDRPAVISVNMLFGALAVQELLARLHPHRNRPNGDYACLAGNLAEMQLFPEAETADCHLLKKHVGRGDMDPLLDRPVLS